MNAPGCGMCKATNLVDGQIFPSDNSGKVGVGRKDVSEPESLENRFEVVGRLDPEFGQPEQSSVPVVELERLLELGLVVEQGRFNLVEDHVTCSYRQGIFVVLRSRLCRQLHLRNPLLEHEMSSIF